MVLRGVRRDIRKTQNSDTLVPLGLELKLYFSNLDPKWKVCPKIPLLPNLHKCKN